MLLVSAALLVLAFGVGRLTFLTPEENGCDQLRLEQKIMPLYAQLDLSVTQERMESGDQGTGELEIVTPDSLEKAFIPDF
ncbi:hypothetical protein APED_33725 [Acanthopleuribacter pedis]